MLGPCNCPHSAEGCDSPLRTANATTDPSRALPQRKRTVTRLNKVKGTSQPGWLPSPRVPLLHRTKDTPVPTATPTLAELATIAHPPMFGCRHPPSTSAPRRHCEPFRFSAFVSAGGQGSGGPHRPADHRAIVVAVNRSGEAIAYDPTTDRIDSDVHRLTALDPARRTLGLATRPADAQCGHSQTSSGSIAFSPPRSTRRSANHPTGSSCAACIPWPKRGHRRVRKCLLITHGTSRRRGRYFVLVRSSTITWTPIRPALASWFDRILRSSLLCVAARSRHRRG